MKFKELCISETLVSDLIRSYLIRYYPFVQWSVDYLAYESEGSVSKYSLIMRERYTDDLPPNTRVPPLPFSGRWNESYDIGIAYILDRKIIFEINPKYAYILDPYREMEERLSTL